MKRLFSVVIAVQLAATSIGLSASPLRDASVGDTSSKVDNADQRLRPLSVCLWNKDRVAALDLSGQYQASVLNAVAAIDRPQFRLTKRMFAECGGESSLAFALTDVGALAGDVNNIRVNQLARCVLAKKPERVFSAIDLMIKKNGRILGGKSSGRNLDLIHIFMSGVRLPQPISTAVTTCDAGALAFVDFNGATRSLFVSELDYEGKR